MSYIAKHQQETIDAMKIVEKSKVPYFPHDDIICSRLGIIGNAVGTGKTRIYINYVIEALKNETDWSTVFVDRSKSYNYDMKLLQNVEESCYLNGVYNPEAASMIKRNKTEEKKTTVVFEDTECIHPLPIVLSNKFLEFRQRNNYKELENIKRVYKRIEVDIIVVPNPIICQWRDELVMSYKQNPNKKNIRCHIGDISTIDINQQDLIITDSTSFYKFLSSSTEPIIIRRLCLDEPLTETNSKRYSTNIIFNYVWLLSGTHIQGHKTKNLTYLYEPYFMMNGLHEIINRSTLVFNINDKTWAQYEKINRFYRIKEDEVYELWKELVDEEHLEMIDSGDFDRIKKLGVDNLYNFFINKIDKKEKAKIEKAEGIVDEIKQYCFYCKSGNALAKIVTKCCQQSVCIVCTSYIDIEIGENYKKCNCPICNERSYCKLIEDSKMVTSGFVGRPNMLVDILNTLKNKKIVLYVGIAEFSKYATDNLMSILTKYNIRSLDEKPREALEEFKDYKFKDANDSIILLLKHHTQAVGLNLQSGTDLIVYNRTANDIYEQVVGRLYRWGLDHDITVHHLYTF